jgi:hypothetical protein
MSPVVGNFVHDLVEMAKAMETLPVIQNELNQSINKIDSLERTVQDRELAIVDYKRQIEELQTKVRSLEVERDDASFRALEKEDSLNQVVRFLSGIRQDVDTTLGVVNPPKPEPVLEIVPEQKPEPIPEPVNVPEPATAPSSTPSEGSWVPEPTPFVPSGHSEAISTHETPTNVETPPTEIVHGPYYGKRYRDVHHYVSINDWLAGGGAKEDYYGVYPNPTAAAQ